MKDDEPQDDSRAIGDTGTLIEEYRGVIAFMRQYATLRFYQLALLLGTTGSIVTALSSQAVRTSETRVTMLKAGAIVVSVALLVMEFRSSTYWQEMRDRSNELAAVLRFRSFAVTSRWSPLTTSGVGFYLHVLVASLWCSSLFVHL